jgi:hypothetical protein
MTYIRLFPTYIEAKQAFEAMAKALPNSIRNLPELTITDPNGSNKLIFIVVSVSVDMSRALGLMGKCDATAVLKRLDELKDYIQQRTKLMDREKK